MQLRISLPKQFVKALARTVGSHARYVGLRLIVVFKAKPRPVVRIYDLRLRIHRHKHH